MKRIRNAVAVIILFIYNIAKSLTNALIEILISIAIMFYTLYLSIRYNNDKFNLKIIEIEKKTNDIQNI